MTSWVPDRKSVVAPGYLATLLAEMTIDDDTPVIGAHLTGVEVFTLLTLILTISGKTFDASTTLDIYVQYSPDEGTTWDDLVHFTQVTSGAMANGSYVVFVNARGASVADRAATDGSLAANQVRSVHWCDRVRVKCVGANIAGTDTISIKVQGFFR